MVSKPDLATLSFPRLFYFTYTAEGKIIYNTTFDLWTAHACPDPLTGRHHGKPILEQRFTEQEQEYFICVAESGAIMHIWN